MVSFSLQDLTEVKAAIGDAYLSNLLRLLTLLDADDDVSNGFQIDTAANTAIDAAVTGAKTLDFSSAATVENDAAVQALATAKARTLITADEAFARYQLLVPPITFLEHCAHR